MIYQNFTNFLKHRTIELIGLSLVIAALLLLASFSSYSPSDPTLVYGVSTNNINNLLGLYGGIVADFLLQSFGLTSFLILITIISWGLSLIIKKNYKN
jgi:S-DNA-T family DNA segregation ATPase FtsK/SpoIIIE